jgi:hypothetical protein
MCEGVCDRCREKVQWKFKYGKYKPLTKPATCQNCKNKTVAKAYRSYCDPCASSKHACASCCGDIVKLNSERRAELAARGKCELPMGAESQEDENETEKVSAIIGVITDSGNLGLDVVKRADMANNDEDKDDYSEEDEYSEDGGMDDTGGSSQGDSQTASSNVLPEHVFAAHITDRDIRKIEDFGASKYSKARVVGSEEDKALALWLQTQRRGGEPEVSNDSA